MSDNEFMCKLLSLLDRIELEEDSSLASQRFDIMDEYGTWKVVGEGSALTH